MIGKLKNLFNLKKTTEPDIHEKIDAKFSELGGDTISIEIGDDLIDFGELLCSIVENVRTDINKKLGFIMPAVHIFNNCDLQENEYVIYIHGKQVEHDFIIPNIEGIEGIYDKLKNAVLKNISSVFTNEITEKYIDTVQKNNGWLIYSLFCKITPPEIRTILTDILNSGHSIKNIHYIFEKIGDKVLVDNKYCDTNPHKISKEIIKEL